MSGDKITEGMRERAITLLTNYVEDDLGDPEFEDVAFTSRNHYELMGTRAKIVSEGGIVRARYGGVTAIVYNLKSGDEARKTFNKDILDKGTVRMPASEEGDIVSLVKLDLDKI